MCALNRSHDSSLSLTNSIPGAAAGDPSQADLWPTRYNVWVAVVPTHQQLRELHQLVVYGGTRGSATSLPSMETLASCQPHFMAFYPPLGYPSVTIFPQSSWELRVYFHEVVLDQILFWGNLHKVGEHFPDYRQEAILPSLSSSVSLTQECVSKKGQDTVIQMVSRTESEEKPEGLIWTAGFVFCLCFNSEPSGTGWEEENVCLLLFQCPVVGNQTRSTTAFSWRTGRRIQANTAPSGCSYPWLGPCCQLYCLLGSF